MNNPFFEVEESSEQDSHGIWAERYRPNKFEDFIGSDTIKESIKLFLQKKEIPHILFYGSPGCGKTSLAKLLVKYIPCDNILINSSDHSGIDFIREQVQEFAMTMGNHPLKVMILDEYDRSTPDNQGIMRGVLETYSSHTRFILTANYQEKIIPAIKSRCQCFEIKPPSKKECASHLAKILTKENVKFENKDVAFIINTYFPDLRKIINFSQQSNINGELKIAKENAIESDYKDKLIELLKTPSKTDVFNEIRQLVADAGFSNYEEVYKYLFEHVSEYSGGKDAGVILQLAEAVYQSAIVFEREITFVAAMHKILKVLNKI